MNRATFIVISGLFILCSFCAKATQNKARDTHASTGFRFSEKDLLPAETITATHPVSSASGTEYRFSEYSGTQQNNGQKSSSVIWLFIQSLIAGLLAVFTPYVYTIHPFTTGYLARNTRSANEKIRNYLIYAFSIVIIFTMLGFLIAVIIKLTGVHRFTEHWIFNLFLCRTFVVLGISFLGAFSLKLPESWIDSLAKKAKSNNVKGIAVMAFTLPGASFSSTFPIIVLVFLLAFNVGFWGPVIGMLGFAVGLGLTFVFPRVLNIFVRYKSLLNNIKVILGFFSLMIALKFLSKADISLGYNLLDRDLFIVIWMALWAIMGVYMLGLLKLSGDIATEENIYGQEYLPLSRLFIAIFAFVFALYLLPGIWGAPLHGVNSFLPQ